MTVENQNSKSGPYALDGGTLRFPRQFFIQEAAHLRVIQVIDGNEVELTTGFTQTGIDEDEGEVVFTEATYPVGGGDLVLKRDIPITQETDYSNQARVRPEQVEDDLDNVVRMIQDIKEVVDRSLHLSVNMDPTDADLDALTRASMAISGAIDEIETVAGNIDAVKTTAEEIEYIQKVSTGIDAIKEFSGSVLSFHDKSFEATSDQYRFDVGAYIYSPENAFVWLNKVRLVPHEQYSTEGTVVQLTSPAAGGDVVDVLVVSAVSSDDVFRARDEAVEAAQALKDVTTVQHKAFLSVAGQKRYTLDASGRPLNVLRDAHTLSGAAPFGDLHYGSDYTVSDGGIDFIEDVPAGHLFLVKTYPATTNAEALALKTEIMEAVDLISEAPQSWADFARFLGYADGKAVSFNGVTFLRDRSASIPGLAPGVGWEPLGDVTALHFGDVVDADSLNAAAAYIRYLGGGSIVTKDEWGQAIVSAPVDLAGVTLKGGQFKHGTGPLHMFTASGSVGALGTLTAAAARGATTISLSNTLGVVAGMSLLITSTDAYATTDAGYRSGEVVEVASVSGSTVTLVSPVQGRIDRSAYAVGDAVRVVNYAKGPKLIDVTVEGDWEAKSAILFTAYTDKPEVRRMFAKGHGNLALRFHTTRYGRVTGGRIQNLRMDLADGRAAYAVALSGSDVGFEMDVVSTDKTRHAFTTMGGPDGFPRKFLVKRCTDFNSLSCSFDTHAAGADYEISNCSSFDSAGSAFQCRAPYGVHHGNTAIRPASHGFQCTENVLSDITISSFTLRDGGSNGISCSQACDNLRILDSDMDGMGAYGIRIFNSASKPSSGAILKGNVIRNWGVTTVGLSGVHIDGTQANTGVLLDGNVFHAGTAGIARAVRLLSVSGGTVKNSTASGTYSATVYDLGVNRGMNNIILGDPGDTVGAAATDPASTMALVNSIRAALIKDGIVRAS